MLGVFGLRDKKKEPNISDNNKKNLKKIKGSIQNELLVLDIVLTIIAGVASTYIINMEKEEMNIVKLLSLFATILPIMIRYLMKMSFYKILNESSTNKIFRGIQKFAYYLNMVGFLCALMVAMFIIKTDIDPVFNMLVVMAYHLIYVFLAIHEKLTWALLDLTVPFEAKEDVK